MARKITVFTALAIGLALAGCDDAPPAETAERVRAIKAFVVSERAGADQRRFSGTLVASDTSGLAFAVSGTVADVKVTQGARVSAGQVLAKLDSTPFDLNVQAAKAELAASRARFSEKKGELDRQQQLFDKGWVAKAALDQALAAHQSAEAELNLARTRLGTAQRDLEKSVLRAPFDGLIAERSVEPFEEVQAGAPLFQINSEGALETVFSVPDKVIDRMSIGVDVIVDVGTIDFCGCTAIISEIGSASGNANTVQVKASLLNANDGMLPGMAANVTVPLSDDSKEQGFLVPLTAIAPGDDTAQGYVFVFDPKAEVVRKVPVQGGDGVDGNFVEIIGGLGLGDVVASAGVSFLRDGQRVRRMGE